MDLTSLNDGDTDDKIRSLVASAVTPVGTPAALCVYPRFLAAAKAALAMRGLCLPVAVVVNFPAGAPSRIWPPPKQRPRLPLAPTKSTSSSPIGP